MRASIYAKRDSGLTLEYFKTPEAAAIDENYLEELIAALARFLASQSSAVQAEGLALVDSDFFLKTQENTYRRFYLITGLLTQYNEETNEYYKGRLLTTIRSLYSKESDDYLKSVLKEGLGDLVD